MLWFTGLLFVTNAVHAATREAWVYATAFAALAATSFLLHSKPADAADRQLFWWIDQLALWCVILIGAYYWQRGDRNWIPIALVSSVALMWYGGHLTESFTFSPDATIAKPAHGVLHVISSIGHHVILSGI